MTPVRWGALSAHRVLPSSHIPLSCFGEGVLGVPMFACLSREPFSVLFKEC